MPGSKAEHESNQDSRSMMETAFKDLLPRTVSKMDENPGKEGFALPQSTLDCFAAIICNLQISNVFEFGSGRSTLTYLECGCRVTSLEDSEPWLKEKADALSPLQKERWDPHVLLGWRNSFQPFLLGF